MTRPALKKVAILAADNMMPHENAQQNDNHERDEQMGKIVPAFAAHGMAAQLVRWRDIGARAGEFDAVLPLFVWDYFEGNEHAFLSQLAAADSQSIVLNSFKCVKWNVRKSYLDELGKSGAPVIQTIVLERVTEAGIAKAFDTLKADKIVIKPQVGGGAWKQVLYTKGEPFPAKDSLPPAEAMVQAFLPSVVEEGEYSFLYFGGQFSHGLIKRAKKGDYRIQSIYGGTEESYDPSQAELDSARAVLDALDFIPLYARVDLLRGLDGTLKLIELEMVEPYLYLSCAEGEGADNKGAQKLAAALAKHLA